MPCISCEYFYRLGSAKLSRVLCLLSLFLAISEWPLQILTSSADGCGPSNGYLGGIWPSTGGAMEWGWTLAHRIGFRNLIKPLAALLPQYRQVHFAAASNETMKRCALTIDDAVGRHWPMNLTDFETLLNILDEYEVSAMFFVIANNASLSTIGKELLQHVVARGHEIGNHGLTDDSMASMSEEEFTEAIDAWELHMTSILGNWPTQASWWKWFRPPKAGVSGTMAKVLSEKGYSVSLPDVWSDDSGTIDADFHARVFANAPCDGSVLLMHVPDSSWGTQILEVLPIALPILRTRGFTFVGLTELFAETPSHPSAWRFFLSAQIVTNIIVAVCALLAAAACRLQLCFSWILKLRRHYLQVGRITSIELTGGKKPSDLDDKRQDDLYQDDLYEDDLYEIRMPLLVGPL